MTNNPDRLTNESLEIRSDPRGIVFEPLDREELSRQQNVHIVLTMPGAIRGNHYHRHAIENVAVVGPALIRFREAGRIREITVPAGAVYKLCIPAGVSHAFQNIGTDPMLLVAFSTQPHDPACPDIIRDQLLE